MMEKLAQLINQDYYNMEKQEFENKAEKVTKTTTKEVKVTVVPKESKFVTAETIKLVEDILNDGTVDIKWRAQLKEQVRKYKGHGE
jgi:hypothetical protein